MAIPSHNNLQKSPANSKLYPATTDTHFTLIYQIKTQNAILIASKNIKHLTARVSNSIKNNSNANFHYTKAQIKLSKKLVRLLRISQHKKIRF
jgi:hypothetical protein